MDQLHVILSLRILIISRFLEHFVKPRILLILSVNFISFEVSQEMIVLLHILVQSVHDIILIPLQNVKVRVDIKLHLKLCELVLSHLDLICLLVLFILAI